MQIGLIGVGHVGAQTVIAPVLDEAEGRALRHSTDVLRQAWAGIASAA